jgi:putative hydrolase of the HAD superfamily
VLFDLDDTLFDHRGAAREALAAVYAAHAGFARHAFDDFLAAHAAHLEALHHDVLAGVLDLERARIERFRRLLVAAGEPHGHAAAAAALYRDSYGRARRPVRGACELLVRLHRQVRIAVVSNNLLAEQQDKMARCGLAPFVDALIVSEAVGITKPDPRIFAHALACVNAAADETVMVGDSWAADVAGARAAGIAPVWFNPAGVEPPPGMPPAVEIRTFEHTGRAVGAIVDSHADRD